MTERLHTRSPGKWQYKVLPLMASVMLLLTMFFLAAGYFLFRQLDDVMASGPQFDYSIFVDDSVNQQDLPATDRVELIRWRQLALLEAHNIQQRYHQAKLFIFSRIRMRFLGFIIGMTLALMGAAFILGQLREPSSEFKVQRESIRFSLLSASPGIMLSCLGTTLMMTAILSSADIRVDDHSTYTARWSTPVITLKDLPKDGNGQLGSVQEEAVKRGSQARKELLNAN